MSDIEARFEQLRDDAGRGADYIQLSAANKALGEALVSEKDKRREDWASTNKWVIGLVLGMAAIVAVAMSNLIGQVNAFNREVRDVRDRNSMEIRELSDRITVVETEREIEKSNSRNRSQGP